MNIVVIKRADEQTMHATYKGKIEISGVSLCVCFSGSIIAFNFDFDGILWAFSSCSFFLCWNDDVQRWWWSIWIMSICQTLNNFFSLSLQQHLKRFYRKKCKHSTTRNTFIHSGDWDPFRIASAHMHFVLCTIATFCCHNCTFYISFAAAAKGFFPLHSLQIECDERIETKKQKQRQRQKLAIKRNKNRPIWFNRWW